MTTLEKFSSVIVVLGDFNPALVTPDWLERNELLGSEDAQVARDSEGLVISHQVTRFETEWFILQVLEGQFSLTSKVAVSESFRDLAVGIFSLLSHIPVTALGINFTAHYRMPTESDYHRIGDVFAPKTIWNDLFDHENHHCGLENLAIRIQPKNQDGISMDPQHPIKLFTIQPSGQVPHGVYLMVNNHHNITETKESECTSSQRVAKILGESWFPLSEESRQYFETLLKSALDS